MIVRALQAAVRTGYRAMGARAFDLRVDGATVHGFRIPARAKPRGPPVVMLHGLGDASTTWYRVVRPLSAHNDLILIDLPGHGLSTLPEGRSFLPPSEKADVVAAALPQIVDEPVALVGQSLGGWVAMWMAVDHPQLVERLVLVCPAGVLHPGSVRARALMQPGSARDVLALWRRLWHRMPSGAALWARPSLAHYSEDPFQGILTDTAVNEALGPAQLRRIDRPTLVVWGADDGLLPSQTPGLLRDYASARVSATWLAECGHLPHQERPGALVDRIGQFVTD